MSGWDIAAAGVDGVLSRTVEAAERFEGWGKDYGTHLESAASSAGTLFFGDGDRPEAGLVGAALAEFAERTQDDLMFIAARAGKSLQGAADATTAYLVGDLTMAEEAQREALKAPEIDLGNPGPGPHQPGGPV
ncbi:DUF6507 family protein [Streptomyces sp. ACA25]|uniref:DUF6507 family protein n=1 Tax=Streptomyces sp. ACA25 TaxID=3022596 RepID=UPI0023082AB6|nr:DUF6507 family protein [Streptomyces sp. ACA25]MDB1090322.1 DUF6507 family protein [Streptomyces sp. ACA25]